MKKNLFLVLGLFSALFVKSQSNDAVTLDFYGFVRIDAYMDTYKGVDAGHDVFYLLPLYATPKGIEDFNEQLSANVTAIASRLGVRINFPSILNAKATGLLEFDFAGNLKSDPTLFRIRQAYSLLTWENASLLTGQTWHPFFGNANMPIVAGLNTGAPFTCFNRSPMIRFNQKLGELTVSASAVTEIQYNSPMVDASDFSYLLTPNHAKRNGVLPEMVLSTEWNHNVLTLGAGAGYKVIKPRMMITGTEGSQKADTYLSSLSYMAYARIRKGDFSLLLKGYLGENMSHLTMPGGYAVSTFDQATGKESYTSYSTYTASLSAVYGKKWQGGIFLGYGSNLGTKEALYDSGSGKAKTYGSFLNMQDMFRVAPHLSFNLPSFKLIAEYEMTGADYGVGNINLENGLFGTTHRAVNNRVIVVMTHYF